MNENERNSKLAIVAGSTAGYIAPEIAEYLQTQSLVNCRLGLFPNGDPDILFEETVRGRVVYFIQTSLTGKTAENVFETACAAEAAYRAGAKSVRLVQLLYPAERQDRRELDKNGKPKRRPITAKVVADMLAKVAGIKEVVTIHLHAGQIEGFFTAYECRVEAISSIKLFIEHWRDQGIINGSNDNVMLLSPDAGGVPYVSSIAWFLGLKYGQVDKRRVGAGENEVVEIIGDFVGKTVILCDDMVDSGGTAIKAAEKALEKGAKEIYLSATHPILTGNAVERLIASPFKKIIFTNTVPLPSSVTERPDRFDILSVGPYLAKIIANLFNDQPLEEIVRARVWEKV